MAMTCFLCDRDGLLAKDALVPALDTLTDGREIPLRNIVLEECACHQNCAAKASSACPELIFYRFLTTNDLLARLIEREKIVQAASAKKEAERAAEAEKLRLQAEAAAKGAEVCVSGRPLLPRVVVKVADKNGNPLQGAAAHGQVRRVLRLFMTNHDMVEERKQARRKFEKSLRAMKLARVAEMREVALGRAC